MSESYVCCTTIVLIVFNRPVETQLIIESLRQVKPKNLIVIADGPRKGHTLDYINTRDTRKMLELVDWECDILKIFREDNLGCMKSIVLGLNRVFEITDRAIILEDDCKPNLDFFKFMEWGLDRFQNEKQIGMISGSNLIADIFSTKYRNDLSIFINIWGWATWKDRWHKHDPFLSIKEINSNCVDLLREKGFNYWQRVYWQELFKFTVYCSDTWDFQLQYSFFKNNLLSVYPKLNLIENIGFSGNGTHTNIRYPAYVRNNPPSNEELIMTLEENISMETSLERDVLLAKVIWSFNPYSALKLKIKNFLIACHILD